MLVNSFDLVTGLNPGIRETPRIDCSYFPPVRSSIKRVGNQKRPATRDIGRDTIFNRVTPMRGSGEGSFITLK